MTGFCRSHGGGPKCLECGSNARDEGNDGSSLCKRHGGGQRCESGCCWLLDPPRALATHNVSGVHLCGFCFRCLYPERARLKVRKEHFVLAEFQRLLPELQNQKATWDCCVPGGCSLKRPDLLYDLGDHYLQVEVDEKAHDFIQPEQELERLEFISNDMGGLPGIVLRLRVDDPPCFCIVTLPNKERLLRCKQEPFDRLMQRATQFWRDRPQGLLEDQILHENFDGAA
jgi:hypothetical protein